MKVLSLFSGIGAFEKALDNLEIPYELVAYCEIDKYASKSYSAIHNVPESMNLGDITKVDEKALPKDIDLITYGFPCQDISLAGKQKGLFNEDGTQTRSGLFFEALRIIEETQPRVAIAENVKNLTGKKFKEQFHIVLDSLSEVGYNNYWAVLNAKDFKIPQNRERVFIVSIRKDIDTGFFHFPEGFPLELRLKDLLEAEVDEKYYLSDKMIKGFLEHNAKHKEKGTGFIWQPTDVNGYAKTLRANGALCPTDNTIEETDRIIKVGSINSSQDGVVVSTEGIAPTHTAGHGNTHKILEEPKCLQVAQMYGTEKEPNPQAGRIYDADGISPTLDTCSGGNRMPKVVEPVNPMPDGTCRTIKSQYFKNGAANLTNDNTKGGKFACTGVTDGLRIRKLTPKECFRLMGFADADFEKAEAVNSNTQLYKQAGNSIVVPVIEYIIIALLECGAFINERKEKEMELRINEVKLPEKITFNYEEIKTALLEKVSTYEALVYGEEEIKTAKADRANLNKLKKALNDERKYQEQEYMQPFNEFKAQVNELIGIVDNAVTGIDSQVKAYEEKCKAEKHEAIKNYFDALEKPFEFPLAKIFDEKWLNASVKMTAICDEIYSRIEKIEADLKTLQNLPDFSFEAIEEYKQTLDLNRAIAEGQRLADIQKCKAEAERARMAQEQAAKEQTPIAPEKPLNTPENASKQCIRFECFLTTEDAIALREFFLSRNIEFKKL